MSLTPTPWCRVSLAHPCGAGGRKVTDCRPAAPGAGVAVAGAVGGRKGGATGAVAGVEVAPPTGAVGGGVEGDAGGGGVAGGGLLAWKQAARCLSLSLRAGPLLRGWRVAGGEGGGEGGE